MNRKLRQLALQLVRVGVGLFTFWLILIHTIVTDAKTSSSDNSVNPARKFQFNYDLKLKNLSPDAKEVTIWIPLPPSNGHQEISDLKIKSRFPYQIIREKTYGNSILKIEAGSQLPESLGVTLAFKVTRQAYSAEDNEIMAAEKTSPQLLKRLLSPDSLVPTTGLIGEEAAKVTKDKKTNLDKARAIYDYVVGNLTYDKSGTGWGRGDALYACQALQGNCTDFHSLFIGMARASGIPARFVMGFPLPPDRTQGKIPGYHCWAEFYIEGKGWVPVDASEADKHPELQEFFFGNLDANRVEFTLGRDLQIDPEAKVGALNYFIHPLVVVDGKEFHDTETSYGFIDLPGDTRK